MNVARQGSKGSLLLLEEVREAFPQGGAHTGVRFSFFRIGLSHTR